MCVCVKRYIYILHLFIYILIYLQLYLYKYIYPEREREIGLLFRSFMSTSRVFNGSKRACHSISSQLCREQVLVEKEAWI